MKKVIGYFSDVRSELSRVTWPKRDEVVRLTLVIVIISGATGIYLGGLDIGLTKLLEYLVSR